MDYQGGYLISRLSKVGGRVFDQILGQQHVDAFNGAQGQILYVLWQRDGISIREISKKTGLAVTSLTSMLDRMEAAELIHRTNAPGDRRKTLIVLTEKARRLQNDYDTVSRQMGEIMYRGFSEDEMRQFENQLLKILNNLEEQERK